ncbi:hypothetical protein ACFLQK_01540 [bacterium]
MAADVRLPAEPVTIPGENPSFNDYLKTVLESKAEQESENTGAKDDEPAVSKEQEEKLRRLKEKRLRILPEAEPGMISYFKGENPDSPIMGMSVMTIDGDGSPGIIFLTAASMEVFQFSSGLKIERVWEGKFVKEFPYRGLAASVFSGTHKRRKFIFVSMNKFQKSFAYRWEDSRLEKAGRANGFFVDTLPSQSVNLMSGYGEGVISFSGPATYFVNTSGDEPEKHNFPIMEDYYSGCILRWLDVSVDLARVALVTEHGIIKVYQGAGKLEARSRDAYGGKLACLSVQETEYLFVSTESGTNDALAVLKIEDEELLEIWRSPALGGAITNFVTCDLDGDGETEILGVLETGDEREMIFRILPQYEEAPVEEESADEEPADETENND